jgi:hypothetical protein
MSEDTCHKQGEGKLKGVAVEARNEAGHHTMPRTVPPPNTAKNYPGKNVQSAEVQPPWPAWFYS